MELTVLLLKTSASSALHIVRTDHLRQFSLSLDIRNSNFTSIYEL